MTSKRGPLSLTEKFYIMNNSEKTAAEIAEDLGRAASTVIKERGSDAVAMSKPVEEEASTEESHEDAERSRSGIRASEQEEATLPTRTEETIFQKSMGKRAKKGQFKATVMTPAASAIADDARQKIKGRKQDLDGITTVRHPDDHKESIKKAEERQRGAI